MTDNREAFEVWYDAQPDRPIKDSWHFERLDRLLSLCLSEPAYSDYLDSLKRVAGFSAELAKPVEQQLPAWHDAPTCAGLWLCNYGILEVVCINQPDVDNFDDFYNAGGRWYGPIPQDAKAEGDAIKKGG